MNCFFFPRKENVLWEFISGNSQNSVEVKLTCLLVKLISFLYLVGSAAPFHTKESANRKSLTKGQPSMGCLNPLDSTAPKVKRGKEREIAKLKRPTALKKVNISTLECLDSHSYFKNKLVFSYLRISDYEHRVRESWAYAFSSCYTDVLFFRSRHVAYLLYSHN